MTMAKTTLTLAICTWAFCSLAGTFLRADDPAPPAQPSADQLATLASSLKWQTGAVSVKDGLAKIQLTDDFRFLSAQDARKVLHDIWGNPDDPGVLGMIFPRDKGPLDPGTWGVEIQYEEEGYVKDNDASTINYTDLLKQMQQSATAANPERRKEGYPAITLVGWATPPHYDAATHKLYWAKDLKFGADNEDTLNYDIRILGRRGALVLSAIAPIEALPEIDQKVPTILAMVDFQPGNTYADFDPKIDKVAEYGLAGLIAGGALAGAAKLGLFGLAFKYIIALVLALKKAIIIVVLAIVAGAKKLWSSFTGRSKTPDHLLPPNPPQ